MRPIPVAFHIGPLQVHTYGIGLALTFWFGFVYFERRLRKNGYPTDWFVPVFLWVILAAVVGARAMHVLSNLELLHAAPGRRPRRLGGRPLLVRWPAPGGPGRHHPRRAAAARSSRSAGPSTWWHPSSWPVGPWAACWAQLMVAGGGHPTHQWFGMYYAGQAGRRLPVPIFQALEDFTVYLILIAHRAAARPLAGRHAPDRAIPRESSSARRWCCGASSARSTSTSGWARTAGSDPTSCSWRACSSSSAER